MDTSTSIPPSAATGSGGGNSNNPPVVPSTTATTQHQPPLLIARTPLNAYLKIAIIRNPTDEVVCNDPEYPGTKKRVVVSDLLDGSLTKVGTTIKEDERKNEEAKTAATTTADVKPVAALSSSPSYAEEKEKSNNKKDEEEGPKKEIPVPTITTVPTYDLDIPPTYDIPTSYVRYIRPTYHETQNETVEYNIDVEDETWWRNNREFGPDAKCKILINGKEQIQIEEGGGQESVAAHDDTDGSNAMDIDNQDNSNAHNQYTIQQVILTNPKYYLRSKHSTQYLLKKYQPKLPLRIMERMIDILEKETGFEFTTYSGTTPNTQTCHIHNLQLLDHQAFQIEESTPPSIPPSNRLQ
mmetsp:Transcript_22438/g.36700  ORF Transcript_22438/g.36700 Transcript_22438/m.36700 type:complete len:353 (+) Transcript_22438:403-1461(+)